MPTISVIVPVYKVEPYIRQCVESVLGQTYSNFELILVDDGSPDSCGSICDEYAEKDSRVRVVHQKNAGLSAARNAGLDIAKGEYVTFIDSDDFVREEYLDSLYNAAKNSECKISICDYTISTDEINSLSTIPAYTVADGLSFFREDHVLGVIACAKLYKAYLFDGIRFPVGKLHEDEAVTYKLLYRAGNIAVIPAKLYYYRQNENGIMRSKYSVKRLDGIAAIEEQCEFFKKINRKDMVDFARTRFIGESCSHILKMEKAGIDKAYIVKTRRKLKQKLILWGFKLGMNPLKNKWEYAIAFPKLYKAFVGIRNLIVKKQKDD